MVLSMRHGSNCTIGKANEFSRFHIGIFQEVYILRMFSILIELYVAQG